MARLVLQFVGKAAELAQSLHRWRQERKNQRAGNAKQLAANPVHDGVGGVRISLALGVRLQGDKNQGLIRGAAGKAETRDGENPFHFRHALKNVLDLLGDALRIFERCPGRRLHRDNEIALVFVGHETFGHALKNQ